MRVIQGFNFYTIKETIAKTNVNEKTLYRYIKEKQVNSIRFMNQFYIREDSVETLGENKPQKFEIVITKGDVANDQWLSEANNLAKLKEWSSSIYTQWNAMNLGDYIAYWCYFIRPIWVKLNKISQKYPSKQWLMDNGFKGFAISFQKRYLEKENITTLKSFFDYLEKRD